MHSVCTRQRERKIREVQHLCLVFDHFRCKSSVKNSLLLEAGAFIFRALAKLENYFLLFLFAWIVLIFDFVHSDEWVEVIESFLRNFFLDP